MATKRLPRRIPTRLCQVPGLAAPLEVPQYILRVDTGKDEKSGTHGWQVRYEKPYIFVPDTKDGRRRSPKLSLVEARMILAQMYEPPHVRRLSARIGRERTGRPVYSAAEIVRAR